MKKLLIAFALMSSMAWGQTKEELHNYMENTLSSFFVEANTRTSEVTWTSEVDASMKVKLPLSLRIVIPLIKDQLSSEIKEELLEAIEEDGFKDAIIKYGGSMTLDFGKFIIVINKDSWEN